VSFQVVKKVLESGSWAVDGGSVIWDYAILAVVAGNSLLLGFIAFQIYRTTIKLKEMEMALGGLFQGLFERLEKFEELAPDLEAPNPLFQILQGMIENRDTKDRDDSGQFRAPIVIDAKE